MKNQQTKLSTIAPIIAGVLSCTGAVIAAIIGLGLPFVEKLATQPQITPAPEVVTMTARQPMAQPTVAVRLPTLLPSPTSTSTWMDTPTPQPATDTPTPTPTDTPGPTPTDTSIPATSAPEPPYDDFDDPGYDGTYNNDLWRPFSELRGEIRQEAGHMVINSASGDNGIIARSYEGWTVDRKFEFEAKLMLSEEASSGNIGIRIFAYPPSGDWGAQCFIEGSETDVPYVGCNSGTIECEISKENCDIPGGGTKEQIPTGLTKWHVVRVEIEPNFAEVNFVVDGRKVGSHIPRNSEELSSMTIYPVIAAYTNSGSLVTGYVDYVAIRP